MTSLPLVSVYIPTHNRADILSNAVESVQAQSYPNIEIMIVDDGSTDSTPAILKQLSSKYENVIHHRFDIPKGACAARNQAINMSSGKFVTGLDDDDRFLPHRISDLVSRYEEGISLISSSYSIYDGQQRREDFPKKQTITLADIKEKNHIGNQAMILRRRVLEVGGFDSNLKAWQDYDLWFRLIHKYGPAKTINNYSYEVNVDTNRTRISTSSNAYIGFQQFIEKHKALLNKKQRFHQEVNDLYNRKVSLSLLKSLKLSRDSYAFSKLMRLYLITRFPRLSDLLIKLLLK